MALPAGTLIGPYEVSGLLGAGGMGEVYRARDKKLHRDVAVKVLPAGVYEDADRSARFEREARTLASLNHPNIATIHGVEDAGSTRALIMELVEGPTLAERIALGPLATDEALAVALQLVDALEAAHEQGVIHRDLKPANIKVRPDGAVKVLDFGLAKVFAAAGEAPPVDPANSPTITGPMMTRAGVTLGTAAYMSPEQARARGVDKRADIWAFGCVLYEMLTARPAFEGDSTTDILAAVVQREPDWSRLPVGLAPAVALLLRRCLQKNPRERLRDIGDARAELRLTSDASRHSEVSAAALTQRAPVPDTRGLSRALLWFAMGAAATAAVLYFAVIGRQRPASAVAPVRVVVSLPLDVTLAFGRGSSVVLSPDGQRLVYTGRTPDKQVRLYMRALDRYESHVLPGTEGAAHPFFSLDGRWVGFFAEGRLKKAALDGGAPVTLAEVRNPRGEAWTREDAILVTPNNNTGISQLPAAGGGRMEPFTTLAEGEMSHRWPRLLDDGSAVLFSVWNDTGWEPARIVAQRTGSTEHIVVVESGGGYPRYLRDKSAGKGYLIFARSEGLLAAPFDEAKLKLTGQPLPVVDSVLTNLSGGAHFDVAGNGTLAYLPGTQIESDRDLAWVTRDGKPTVARRIERMGRFFTLSPDGTRVLRVNTVGQREIWMEDLERGTTTRLTNAPDHYTGLWSPDGTAMVFARGAPISNLYWRSVDQSGNEERLTTSPRNQQPHSFSPDGPTLAYVESDPATGADIWVMPLPAAAGGGRAGAAPAPQARPFVQTKFSENNPAFSPDGRWVAYQSNESGRFEVYARSFPDGKQTVQISAGGGIAPAWSRTGREIFYRSTNQIMMVADASLSPAFGKPRALFDATGYENDFAVSPDGQRLLMMPLVATEQSATQIHVILNFLSELRQRVR